MKGTQIITLLKRVGQSTWRVFFSRTPAIFVAVHHSQFAAGIECGRRQCCPTDAGALGSLSAMPGQNRAFMVRAYLRRDGEGLFASSLKANDR